MATTFDLPASMVPQLASFGLQKSGGQFRGLFTTGVQSIDGNAERWVCSLTGTPKLRATAGAVEAFLNIMAGGVNKVRIYHPFRPQPLGTLRGSPTIGTTAALEATSLVLANAVGTNLLLGGGFEFDTNADGLSNGVTAYSGGTTGAITYARASGSTGFYQQVSAASLGASSSDRAGFYFYTALSVSSGETVSFSLDILGSPPTKSLSLVLQFNDIGGSALSGVTATFSADTARRSVSGAAPAGTASVIAYLYMHTNTSGAAVAFAADNAQLQVGQATAYEPGATLLMGDILGSAGQLFQVAADCVANDALSLTVPLVNRVSAEIASTTAMTWYRPTAEFVCPAMLNRSSFRPGSMDGAVIDLEQAA